MIVLVLGGDDDEHAVHVTQGLRARGARAHLIDSLAFPASLELSFDPIAGDGVIRLPDGPVAWSDVDAVYWRCYNGIAPADLPDPDQAYIAENDTRSLFESFLIELPARWVNGWSGYQLHQTKPAALARVAALDLPPGLRLPRTALVNDPEALQAFVARTPDCIFKPVQGGAHTRPLTPGHLTEAHLERLALSPVTIQERVVGTDVRVFVAGERVLACEIATEATDFRDDPDPPMAPVELPGEIADACRRIAAALDLCWAGIDLRLTSWGDYVYFEANPSPMFLGFESRSGLPIGDALLDLLM